ncbi:MAG: HAD family phosphatase [Akkermansiaceae bacterium]|jgi:putative hydrolase of the HAD superfamily
MTFLFDIGNVLLKLHFERFHAAVLGSEEIPLPEELDALKVPYETGAIDDDAFVDRSLEHLTGSLSREQFTAAWEDIFSANEPMWLVVEKLKASNHRLILFSNTNNLHAGSFLKAYPGFDDFDHHHFSHQVGALKPHPDFYQRAIEDYELNPTETIYLDDLPENIATGKEMGFHSWQYDYNDHQSCLNWLHGLGIKLTPSS